MPETQDKQELAIKRVASIADSWWKLVTIFATVIFMIYNVSAAWIEIKATERDLQELKESIVKDNATRDDRATKRYERAVQMYDELKEANTVLEQELEDQRIEDAYQRGKTDAAIEFLKKQ